MVCRVGGGGGGAGVGDVSWVEITKVRVLNILVGVDFDDSFHERVKTREGVVRSRILIFLSYTLKKTKLRMSHSELPHQPSSTDNQRILK